MAKQQCPAPGNLGSRPSSRSEGSRARERPAVAAETFPQCRKAEQPLQLPGERLAPIPFMLHACRISKAPESAETCLAVCHSSAPWRAVISCIAYLPTCLASMLQPHCKPAYKDDADKLTCVQTKARAANMRLSTELRRRGMDADQVKAPELPGAGTAWAGLPMHQPGRPAPVHPLPRAPAPSNASSSDDAGSQSGSSDFAASLARQKALHSSIWAPRRSGKALSALFRQPTTGWA